MSAIYCKKCGLRGDSKCPHCRSIFSNAPYAQEMFEQFLNVRKFDKDEEPGSDGQRRWLVGVWTYAVTDQEAMGRCLRSLQAFLTDPEINIEVVACLHDWDLMPGVKSSIGCGCVGAANDNVPADPFATTK